MTSKAALEYPKLYCAWRSMRKRCRPNYLRRHNYFDRGIKVCKRWDSFALFLKDMGLPPTTKHTIDRIDNDKGYSPSNCRWATTREQNRNTRDNIFTENDIREIRALRESGLKLKDIAAKFNTTRGYVCTICTYGVWKDI